MNNKRFPNNSVVAVLRCFANANVTKQVDNLLTFLSKVVVVVNEAIDKGSTIGWLAKYKNDRRVTILSITEGYTWVSALNAGLNQIILENNLRRALGEDPYSIVFPVSVEAKFTIEDAKRMFYLFDDSTIGIVGTTFQGMQSSNKIELGPSYRHPRNTGMMIRLNLFQEPGMGFFDKFCDDAGGMEDLMFVVQMQALTRYRMKMVDQKVPLIVGVNYNQTVKEQREYQAMCKVVRRLLDHAIHITNTVRKMEILRPEDLESIREKSLISKL